MSDFSRQPRAFLRTWLLAMLLPVAVCALWLSGGVVLSGDYFNQSQFEFLHVLTKGNVLAFMPVVLVILVPLFILFLETMKKSGYVYKIVLPEITRFRELAFVLLACVVFVLLSPRASFLYPVTTLFVVAITFAMVQALDVVFRIESYTDDIRNAIVKWVRGAFGELLRDRVDGNKTHDWVKKNEKLIQASYWHVDKKKSIRVRAGKSGYLRKFRNGYASFIIRLFKWRYKDAKLSITPLFGGRFNKDDDIVFIASEKPVSKLWLMLLQKTYKITSKSPRLEMLEKVLDDFEQRLIEGIERDNRKLINESLELYRFVTDEFDAQVKGRMIDKDSSYNFTESVKDVQ